MLQRLGFIGTGTITEAVIDGLASSSEYPAEIHVSPRNAEIAARLSARYAFVHVASDNQNVLDRCDVVCLAVRPQIAEEVLATLRFSERHHVLSFIAALRVSRLQRLLPNVARIARLAPLPMVARKLGTTIIYPEDAVAVDLFSNLGTSLALADEATFDVFLAASALMGTFFATLHQQAGWLQTQGVDPAVARSYLASLYFGLSATAKETDTPFAEMVTEFSTLGGLNEQVARDLAAKGAFEAHSVALDRILERIVKR
jgi:pyrroline-5-carboxylate reductase